MIQKIYSEMWVGADTGSSGKTTSPKIMEPTKYGATPKNQDFHQIERQKSRSRSVRVPTDGGGSQALTTHK